MPTINLQTTEPNMEKGVVTYITLLFIEIAPRTAPNKDVMLWNWCQ